MRFDKLFHQSQQNEIMVLKQEKLFKKISFLKYSHQFRRQIRLQKGFDPDMNSVLPLVGHQQNEFGKDARSEIECIDD